MSLLCTVYNVLKTRGVKWSRLLTPFNLNGNDPVATSVSDVLQISSCASEDKRFHRDKHR